MQDAKDTFYVTVRDRLSALNASRTVVVRGQVRTAVLVDENEEARREADTGVFHLQWGDTAMDGRAGLMVESAVCRVVYRSGGDEGELGRGRAMETMHAELTAMLEPRCVQKQRFTEGGAETMLSTVWWFEDGAREVKSKDGAMEAVATVRVLSRREVGE